MGSLYTPSRSPPPKIRPLPAFTQSPPSSPPSSPHKVRKVISDFAAFGVSKNASVFGTAVQSTPFSLAGGKAAFGSIRPGAARSGFEDDDEDEDDRAMLNGQKVELREGAISLEQVGCVPFFFFCGFKSSFLFFRPSGLRCRVRGEASDLNFLFFFVCSCSLVVETISDSLPQSVFFF